MAGKPTVDDLRTAFYRQARSDRMWIREVHLEPLELIVSNDTDGSTVKVPATVSASGEIAFGRPRRVRVEYAPVDEALIDASTLVFASAADSREGSGFQVHAYAPRKEAAPVPQPQNQPPTRPPAPRQTSVAASSPTAAPPRIAGADARIYARNPAVDELRAQPRSTVYAEAAQFGGPTPTLFPEGDLPHATTSGISPHILAAVPWYGRHAVAAAATTAEAEDLIDDLSSPGHLVEDYINHPGNRDYQSRVRDWSMRGVTAAAEQRNVAAAAERLNMSRQQVAASTSTAEPDDDTLYDSVFGDSDRQNVQRHLEYLANIVEGNTLGAPYTQKQARDLLAQYAGAGGSAVAASVAGDGMPHGARIRVPADAARRVLDRVDRTTDVRWSR